MRLYHGGVPGLRPGDLIEPGHERKAHDGCPWCAARAAGTAGPAGIDPPSERHAVYMTPHRLYAAHHASLWGRGDLYQVEPIGDLVRSTEDTIETWCAPLAVVLVAVDRAVTLTMSERRRLSRHWGAADALRNAQGAP